MPEGNAVQSQHKEQAIVWVREPYDPAVWDTRILQHKIFTYEDYQTLPEGSAYQLIGGRLVMTPAPEVYHQEIVGNLYTSLRIFVSRNRSGKVYFAPADVKFSETDVFQPDIFFIHKDRTDIIGRLKIDGPPDLVMEVLSPSAGYWDLREKYDVYEAVGVREYWIVDPRRKEIEVFENIDGQFQINNKARTSGRVSSVILSGFSVDLADIFEPPDLNP